ncbi:MAG: outer membrane beta-barrel protein [Bacteroidaceae bacterium]|nr:outer membrane beta-barrel protein [Bacteroidaceae bacterium]
MKKMILTALVAVVSLAANAQFWAGGEVGYSHSRTTVNKVETGKANNFSLLPEIGYKLNDKFDVAMKIGFAHGENDNTLAGMEVPVAYDYANAFVLNPYLRYTFAKAGDFSFFADGGFAYVHGHICGDEYSTNAWQIAIKPGISYALSEKVGLVAHVGGIAYSFAKYNNSKTNGFDMGVSGNNITFGAYVNF